jgi:hypothetical protein
MKGTMKIIDDVLRKSKPFVALIKWVELTNTAVNSLFKLSESIAKELETQRNTINNLTKLCEMILNKDPQLQELLNKVSEKKKDVN